MLRDVRGFLLLFIDAYDTPWIDKSLLSLSEIDTVVPFEPHAGKVADISRFSNILLQMFLWLPNVGLAIGKRAHRRLTQRHTDVLANLLGQIAIGGAGENF